MAGGDQFKRFTRAFQDLANTAGSNSPMTIKAFTDACSELTALKHSVGFSFLFDGLSLKVEQIKKMSGNKVTLKELVDQAEGSRSILSGLSSALGVVKVFFEELLKGRDVEKAGKAVFVQYPDRTTEKKVEKTELPVTEALLRSIGLSEQEAKKEMQKYIDASVAVTNYINGL